MPYPNILYGPEGEQYNTYATQRWPFGTLLILQDGREYRFAKAGAVDLVAGNVLQGPANTANHVNTTSAANAAGARTITTTLGATAATLNQYAEGFAVVSVAPGSGQVYKLASNPAVLSSGSFVGTLADGQAVRVALTTTSRVDLIPNAYSGVIQGPTTLTGVPVGVAVSVIPAANFGWIQVHGEASVLTNGTVVLGAPVVPSGTTAGACEAASTTIATTVTQPVIGFVRRVAATTAWSTIMLTGLE